VASVAITYEVQVTSFGPGGGNRKLTTDATSEVASCIETIPPEGGVVFVAALAPGVDRGNFYLFRNEDGRAHIMLHEHREHFASDHESQGNAGVLSFRGEDGEPFSVSAAQTTSWERGKAALLHWLPDQARWPELTWA
jgi:hypothetical protein